MMAFIMSLKSMGMYLVYLWMVKAPADMLLYTLEGTYWCLLVLYLTLLSLIFLELDKGIILQANAL